MIVQYLFTTFSIFFGYYWNFIYLCFNNKVICKYDFNRIRENPNHIQDTNEPQKGHSETHYSAKYTTQTNQASRNRVVGWWGQGIHVF